jgi:FkbM family methyltransferase
MMSAQKSAKFCAKRAAEILFPGRMYARRISLWTKNEPELRILPALCSRDRLSLDVGAHQGLYVWHLLPISKRVVAFEPLPQMVDIFRSRYGDRVRLEEVILSDHEGKGELRYPKNNYGLATVQESNPLALSTGRVIESITVPMKTLDSFALKDVGFLKIDVEGHEEAVLRGSVATITRERPNLLIEIEERHSPQSLMRIRALLERLGFSGYFVDASDIVGIDSFDQKRDQPISNVSEMNKTGRYINNFLFLPRDKADTVVREAARYLQAVR